MLRVAAVRKGFMETELPKGGRRQGRLGAGHRRGWLSLQTH